jgi:hypothetical protein
VLPTAPEFATHTIHRGQRPRLQRRLSSGTEFKTTDARRGDRLYNFSNSLSAFESVTGALHVKFSHT